MNLWDYYATYVLVSSTLGKLLLNFQEFQNIVFVCVFLFFFGLGFFGGFGFGFFFVFFGVGFFGFFLH